MKKKVFYTAPEMEVVKINVDKAIMGTSVSSVESMSSITGSWDEEE